MPLDDKDLTLDKDRAKRLEKLEKEWSEPQASYFSEKVSAADLRLLLEHSLPVQNLIRAIATMPVGESPSAMLAAAEQQQNDLSAAVQAQHQAEHDLAEVQQQLNKANTANRALADDLQACSQQVKTLLTEQNRWQTRYQQLEQLQQQQQGELQACQAKLASTGQVLPELNWLRQDMELASDLGLSDLPADNTLALVKMVAVLAQRDGLERLWQSLKARCEGQNRAVTDAEQGLLQAALTWYNYNWQTRPYQRVAPALGTMYDYAQHQRSRHTLSGEQISELRLMGIADGSGRVMSSCKALVSTH